LSNGNAHNNLSRRHFLGLCGKVALVGALPFPALAAAPQGSPSAILPDRILRLLNIHTGESLTCTYLENGQLVPDVLIAINHILRDHRTGEIKAIDPALLDRMSALAARLDTIEPFHIVSGYRSPATNEALRRHSRNVARHSYHLVGKAVDLSLPGVTVSALKNAALAQRAGGVGYYPRAGFVHIDTGAVRAW